MTVYKIYCRAFQKIVLLGQFLWSWKEPALLQGSVLELPALIKSLGLRRVLLVTDEGLMKLGLPEPLLRRLEQSGIFCAVYDKTVPNPTTANIEEARRLYMETNCEAVIAFGGGSPMDCAKLVCLLIAYPQQTPEDLAGILPFRLRALPKLFAIPTTAGTGSEVSVAAIVTDAETRRKYSVLCPRLRPKYAVLDPALTVGLPPRITAATGMDALTHAVEAYIGQSNVKHTARQALRAVALIFRYLETAAANGSDIEAREQMLLASYSAGVAFTRAFVGYAHGIVHALGGLYDIPHGEACAAALPHVLDFYGKKARRRLARLADAAGIAMEGQTEAEKAQAFVQAVRDLNARLGLPAGFRCIKEEDLAEIAARCLKECNPLYPVPRIMGWEECVGLAWGMRG